MTSETDKSGISLIMKREISVNFIHCSIRRLPRGNCRGRNTGGRLSRVLPMIAITYGTDAPVLENPRSSTAQAESY